MSQINFNKKWDYCPFGSWYNTYCRYHNGIEKIRTKPSDQINLSTVSMEKKSGWRMIGRGSLVAIPFAGNLTAAFIDGIIAVVKHKNPQEATLEENPIVLEEEHPIIPDTENPDTAEVIQEFDLPEEHKESFKQMLIGLLDTDLGTDELAEIEGVTEREVQEEMVAIDQILQAPSVKNLMEFLESSKCTHPKEIMGVLCVIVGIKPVFQYYTHQELKNLGIDSYLQNILEEFPNVGVIYDKPNGYCYIVNEKPLPIFDPRRYLKRFNKSIAREVQSCFPNQGSPKMDQRLSYLLGFGPSWEALAINGAYGRKPKLDPNSQYTQEHFKQTGTVLCEAFDAEDVSPSSMGKFYYNQFLQFVPITGSIMEKCAEVNETLSTTNTNQVYNGLTMRTEYFRKAVYLKKYLLEKLNQS